MKMKFIWMSIFLWLSTISIMAQDWDAKEDFQTKFTKFTTKDGLSNDKILDIIQDKSGYIWLATEDGLNRFDAYDFLIFKNTPTDSSTISSNLITCLAEDIYGNLWVGTTFGLNKYDRLQNRFVQYFFDRTKTNTIRNNHIRALHADEKGFLWIETMGGFLHKLDIKKGEIQYFKHGGVQQKYYHYHDIFQENDSILWLGGRNMEVHQFNINTNKFHVFHSVKRVEKGKKKTNDVSSFFIDSKNQLWVTGLDGAYKLKPKTSYFELFLQGSTFSIFEDNSGCLWFGTGNGIYKYHPSKNQMTHINVQENNPHSLSNNHINKIIKDKSGVVWIATNNGLNLYSPKKNNFKHYFHIPGQENTISGNYVTDIVQDKTGDLWIATASNGLNKMNLKTGEVKPYKHQKSRKNGLLSNHISHLFFDSNDKLWIATWAGLGFQRLNTKTAQFTNYTIDPKTTNVDWYHGFYEDKDKNIHLAVWGGYGLYTLTQNSKKTIFTGKNLKVIPNGFNISSLDSKSDSILWLGGNKGQINAYNFSLRSYIHFKKHRTTTFSFHDLQKMQEYGFVNADIPPFDTISQTISCFNKTFFATESGLIVYDNSTRVFTKEFPKTLINTKIQRMAFYKNKLFVLSNASLWVFDSLSNQWTEKGLSIDAYHNKPVDIIADSSGLWIAIKSKLFLVNHRGDLISSEGFDSDIKLIKQNKRGEIFISLNQKLMIKSDKGLITEIQLPEPIIDFVIDKHLVYWLSKNQLYSTHIISKKTKILLNKIVPKIDVSELQFSNIAKKNNSIFMGSNKGLLQYNIVNLLTHFIRDGELSLMGYPVHLLTCIAEGNNENVWLGTTSSGIAKWQASTNSLTNYVSNEFDSSAFWGKDVSFVFKDSKNRVWMGAKGLNLFHPESNSFSHFTTSNGLAHDEVKGMTEDLHGRLWIATKKGLSCFSIPELNFTNYYESHGLPDNELTGGALSMNDGRLAFATKTGFTIFHPDSLIANHFIPPVLITELQIQDNQIFNDLSQIDTIIIDPQDKRLLFRFAALDYNSPEQNMYQYKLEGLDEEWTYTDAKNRAISYSNLSHGTYVFKLKGSNNNDVWNEYGKNLCIIILPHYYQKWWFYLLILLFVGFIIWMIVIYRVRELKLQHKAAELEQRFLRAQMNPHFIFNSLGAIQSFIFKNEPIEAATYLSNFSELVRLILDNSRQDLIPLETEIKTLHHYLDLQLLRFGEKFEFKLEVDENLENRKLLIPPMLAQPFIENSIEHAFAGMKEKGQLNICFRHQKNELLLICEDNGMGIEASMKQKKDNIKKHKSLATKITRERIKVLNKVYPSKISLEILDLKKADPKRSGTRVVFGIPYTIANKNIKQ